MKFAYFCISEIWNSLYKAEEFTYYLHLNMSKTARGVIMNNRLYINEKQIHSSKIIKGLALVLGFILMFPIMPFHSLKIDAAEVQSEQLYEWVEDLSLDLNADNANEEKDKILLRLNLEDTGTYLLEYYLEDDRKTSVEIYNNGVDVDIHYKVEEYDDNGTYSDLTDDIITNITQSLIDGTAYKEKDYTISGQEFIPISNREIDEGETVVAYQETLDYSISSSPTTYKSAIGFQLDNKYFIARWNYGLTVPTLDIMIQGYEAGTVFMTKLVETPGGDTAKKEILKELAGFEAIPIYLIDIDETTDNVGDSQEVESAIHPDFANITLGDRPGLEINFEHPRKLDENTWSYYDENDPTRTENIPDLSALEFEITLDGVGDAESLDIQLMLQNGGGTGDKVIESNSIEEMDTISYSYSYPDYRVLVTGILPRYNDSDPIANVKTVLDPLDSDNILGWNDLESSSIYAVEKGFSSKVVDPETAAYEFLPKGDSLRDYAYTYLEYYVYRANEEESYLRVKPYDTGELTIKEYEIYYSGTYNVNDPNPLQLWSTHYEESNDNDTYVNISIDVQPTSLEDYFQVKVDFDNQTLASQIMRYEAINAVGIPPAPPVIEAIDNLRVVPPNDDSNDPTRIEFDLTWDAIENSVGKRNLNAILENSDGDDKVYYEVLVNQTPLISLEDDLFEVFRVYEMYEDAGVYKMRLLGPDPLTNPDTDPFNNDSFRNDTTYTQGYNLGNQEIRADEINVYEDGTATPKYTTTRDPKNEGTYTYVANGTANFDIDGVNYLRMRVITEKDGVFAASEYSAPVSLTLNTTRRFVPIVEGLTYEAVFPSDPSFTGDLNELLSIELDWPKVDVSDYENYMLSPLDKSIDQLDYYVYLSEDKELIQDLEDATLTFIEEAVEAASTENAGRVVIDETNLDGLRDGSVIFFPVNNADYATDTNITIPIDGLDLNNTYYVRIVVRLTINDEDPDPSREGDPSAIIGITVPIIPDEPGTDEILPLAPEEVVIDFYDTTKIPTTIEWNIPGEITVKEDTYGFEVFSIESSELPEYIDANEIDPTGDITSIGDHMDLAELKTEAFRIYYEGTDVVLKKYNEENDSWIVQDASLIKKSDGAIWIVDADNSPNRVLYYYVRTINIKQGEPLTYSAWIAGTITSNPIKPPINLIVDYNSDYEMNVNTETIIRFDAPIENISDLDSKYFVEIWVKGEADNQYYQTNEFYSEVNKIVYSSKYVDKDEYEPVGYIRIYYKIYGLSAGKSYDIKVRIEDRTKDVELIDGEELGYPVSQFSKTVTTRTEFNQDDYDKEQKYNQYIDYYLEKSEGLTQNPYYQLETTETMSTAKYRANYADGLIRINKDKTFDMIAFDKTTNVYYIPSSLISTANDYNVTYVFEPKGQSIALHPFSIGKDITNEITETISDINEYGSNLEDYYVKLLISVGEYGSTINGQIPSSDMVNIQMSIIASKMDEEDMDIALEVELNRIIGDHKSELIEQLDTELESGINDVKLTRIVQNVLAGVQSDFYSQGQQIFDEQIIDKGNEVTKLNKNITIGISSDLPDSSNIVYGKTSGGWEVQRSTYYNQKYNIESKELGSFMSVTQTGSEILGEIYTSEQLSLVNKYGLADIFTNYELKTPETIIYNNQMVRTLARLLGANDLEDNISYLKKKGVSVPYFKDYNQLNNENANYLYVQIYALKNQLNLKAVVIRDYNQIEDIRLIDEDYRETLLKGVSLGIIQLEQGQIMPDETMELIEFFELIDNIE